MEQALAGGSPLHGAGARGRLAIAWSRRSREARHCMEQALAGGSPLHGAGARGRLAIAWSRRSREARHCMEQALAGGSPLHGADARGRLAIAWSRRSREARTGVLLPTDSARPPHGQRPVRGDPAEAEWMERGAASARLRRVRDFKICEGRLFGPTEQLGGKRLIVRENSTNSCRG
jgi:hypothetical protein